MRLGFFIFKRRLGFPSENTFYDFIAFNIAKFPIFGTLLTALMVWAFRLAKNVTNEHRDRSSFHPDRLPPREN